MSSLRYPWWGKAGHGAPETHSALPAHLLAVTACLRAWLELPHVHRPLAHAWRCELPIGWLLVVGGLHDVGKLCVEFQGKRPDVVAWVANGGRLEPNQTLPEPTTNFDHSVVGGQRLCSVVLQALLPAAKRTEQRLLKGLLRAAFAHHGHHPQISHSRQGPWRADRTETQAAAILADDLKQTVEFALGAPLGSLPPIPEGRDVTVAHLVAGAIAIADWLGSDAQTFAMVDCLTFEREHRDPAAWAALLEHYTDLARARLRSLGLNQAACPIDPVALLGTHAANAVQRAVLAHELRPGPLLAVIEAPMASGKTEAALMLAVRLIQSGQARGLAFALPGQASANMMFARLHRFATSQFGTDPNLAHGQAAWLRERLLAERASQVGERSDEEANAHLDDWLTDDNKKAALAPVSAMTVDQMELAVLHSRHGFVRAAALAQHVVVIDEVHAYDAYMQAILASLLRLLGAAGVPTILLSATLPQGLREGLVDAYTTGAGIEAGCERLDTHAYPRITWADVHSRIVPQPIEWDGARLSVRLEATDDACWTDAVHEAVAAGQCVCVLANTVQSALARHAELARTGVRSTLLHARFRAQDRQSIQRQVEQAVGKDSKESNRRGYVVVATQVIEQSIDVDFDLMLSEPAPIDLILQRMGRLHRHRRDYRSCPPRFLVIEPRLDAAWWRNTLAVYRDGDTVRPSLQLLEQRVCVGQAIELPREIPILVEQVYGVQASLTDRQLSQQDRGVQRCLDHSKDIDQVADGAEPSSATRDGANSVQVLLVDEEDDGESDEVPTTHGTERLPERMHHNWGDGRGARPNPAFLERAQPWLMALRVGSREFAAIQTRDDRPLERDWRTNAALRPDKPPPFFIVPVRRLGTGIWHVTPEWLYTQDKGLHRAQARR